MVQPVRLAGSAHAGEPCVSPPIVTGRRGAARLRLAIPVRLVAIHTSRNCVLLDLSRSGARIGLERPLAPGDCAYLQIAGIEVFAEVVRRAQGAAGGINGLAFDEPLDDAAVLAVRRHAETFEQRTRESLRDLVRRWVNGEDPA